MTSEIKNTTPISDLIDGSIIVSQTIQTQESLPLKVAIIKWNGFFVRQLFMKLGLFMRIEKERP